MLLREVDWHRVPRPIDFDTLLWPRIVGDAFIAHATTLRRVRPAALATGAGDGGPDAVLEQIAAAVRRTITPLVAGTVSASLVDTVDLVAAAVAPFVPDRAERFDLAGEIRPVHRPFASPAEFDAWVTRRVASDLHEVDLGEDSPLKAGLWSVSSARAFAAQVGTLGGFDAESRRSGAALLTALGAMVGSGPPAFRNNELLALARAGIVLFIGPEASLDVGDAAVRCLLASRRRLRGRRPRAHRCLDALPRCARKRRPAHRLAARNWPGARLRG